MHVGHCRGAIFGDVLSNLLLFNGNKVTKEFYVNDYGKQIEDFTSSVFYRLREIKFKEEFPNKENLYPGEYIVDIAKKILKKNNKINLNNYNNLEIVNWDINKNISLPNQLATKGEIVFVDITADWCITCQVNKSLVLETKQVSEIFKRNNVKVLVLDWTKPNKNIKKFLTKKQRYGIPYNEIYGPLLLNGKILSELLTTKEIQKYIKIAK